MLLCIDARFWANLLPTTVYVDFDAFVRLALVDIHKKGKVMWRQVSKVVVEKAYKWLGLRFVVEAYRRSYRVRPGNSHSLLIRLLLTTCYLLTAPWSVPATFLLRNIAWRLKIFHWLITSRPYLLPLRLGSDTAVFSLYIATLSTAISIGLNGYNRTAEKGLLLLTILSGDSTSVANAWHKVAKETQVANEQSKELRIQDFASEADTAEKLACLANIYTRIYVSLRTLTSLLAYGSFVASFSKDRVTSYIGAELCVGLILANLLLDAGYPLYVFGDIASRRLELPAARKREDARPTTPFANDGAVVLGLENADVDLDTPAERMKTASRLLDTYRRPRFFCQRRLININPEQMVRLLRHFAGEQFEVSESIDLRADLNSWLNICTGVNRQGRLVPIIVGVDNNNYHWSALHVSPEGEMTYFDPFFSSDISVEVMQELEVRAETALSNTLRCNRLMHGHCSACYIIEFARFIIAPGISAGDFTQEMKSKDLSSCFEEYFAIIQEDGGNTGIPEVTPAVHA